MRIVMTVVVLVLACVAALPALANPTPQVTDPAGDANAVNGQGILVGGVASGTSTPVSYGPADLRSVSYATTYTPVPVGGNGTSWVQSGVEAKITTTAPPVSDSVTLIYRLNVTIGSCGGFVQFYSRGPASGPLDAQGLEFRQFAARGCAADATIRPTGWVGTVSGNTLTFTMPLAGLSGMDRLNFGEGKTIDTLSAEVRTLVNAIGATLTAPAIDITGPGTSFTIGSDRPANVPCTVGCP